MGGVANTHTTYTRVYYAHGRVAHLCSDSNSHWPLCNNPAACTSVALGTGDQSEIDHAASLPTCTRCDGLYRSCLGGRLENDLVRSSVGMPHIEASQGAVVRALIELRKIDPSIRSYRDVSLAVIVAVALAEYHKRTQR